MTNTKSKTALQFILGGIMLVSVATIGCNDNTDAKKDAKTDTVPVQKMTEEAPPAVVPDKVDSTTQMPADSLSKRPIVPGNKPAPGAGKTGGK